MDELQFKIDNEEDVIMLESLIKSPAFQALRRAISGYRATTLSTLYTSSNSTELFRSQGVMIGLGVLENLPGQLVHYRQQKITKTKADEKFKQTKKPDVTK